MITVVRKPILEKAQREEMKRQDVVGAKSTEREELPRFQRRLVIVRSSFLFEIRREIATSSKDEIEEREVT